MADLEEMLRAAGLAGTDGSFVDPETFRSGFVTLIGRPNAGKSTLLNAVMGEKLAITSNTPQTTRHRFRAIYDSPEMQMIMVDTPGLRRLCRLLEGSGIPEERLSPVRAPRRE